MGKLRRECKRDDLIAKGMRVDFDHPYTDLVGPIECTLYPVYKNGIRKIPSISRNTTGKKTAYIIYHVGKSSISAARLYYAMYHGSVPVELDVDHVDGNAFNNTIENLQLLTHRENITKKFLDNPELLGEYRCYCAHARDCKLKKYLDSHPEEC